MFPLLDEEQYAKEKAATVVKIKKLCPDTKDPSLIDEYFIEQVLHIVLVNPSNGFLKQEIQPKTLGRLVELCLVFIAEENSLQMTILKLRKQFSKIFIQDWTPEKICSMMMNNHESDIDSRLESLTVAIVTTPHTNDRHGLSIAYEKIVNYIILNSGLGTPDKPSVVKETRTALSSVFHVYSVKPFLNKTENEKREQLKQLTNIVTGIRLFYWHYGEYGDGIENIPDALVKGLNKSIHDLEKRKIAIQNQIQKYTDALLPHYTFPNLLKNDDRDCNQMAGHPLINNFKPNEVDDVNIVKTALNLLHEYIKLVNDILYVLKYAQQDVSKTNNEFHEALVDLQKFTKYKNKYIVTEYVPTDIVVHKFTNIAALWKTLWRYLVSVHALNDLEETLNITFNETELPSDLVAYFSEINEESSEQRPFSTDVYKKEISDPLCKLVDYKPHISLKFNGFSTIFVILEGFLVPSNLNKVIQYKDEHYSFSNEEEMFFFCKNTDKHLSKTSDTLHQHPELLNFFQIKDTYKKQDIKKCETGIQTELHPIPNLIDKNYHFNAYELMRRHQKQAIAYLNSRHKATKTCSVEDVATQTYDKRSVSTQESDKATSMPRPLRYIYGLRGFNNDSVIQDDDYVPFLNIQL